MIDIDKPASRPPILMSDSDSEKLSALALAAESHLPQVAALLLAEIGRAEIVRPDALPADVVTILSTVEFVDEGSGAQRTVQLVYPSEADITAGRVSILTPIGAGLIGLREGQSIAWPDRNGREHQLRIIKVTQQSA